MHKETSMFTGRTLLKKGAWIHGGGGPTGCGCTACDLADSSFRVDLLKHLLLDQLQLVLGGLERSQERGAR